MQRVIHITGYVLIASLLLIACISAYFLASQRILNYSKGNMTSTISWKPFSEGAKESALRDGKKVLVFVFAELNEESTPALEDIDAYKAERLCDGADYEALLLRYKDWDDIKIRSIWKDVGHTKKPMLVLYAPNRAPLAYDPFSLRLVKK